MYIIEKKSFLHQRLQKFTANMLFPSGKGDWYRSKGYGAQAGSKATGPYEDFCRKQKNDAEAYYYDDFKNLTIDVKTDINSKLANGDDCTLESFICSPEVTENKLPGTGKHVVYFPGANTYYQACFRDISTAARETGATVHAFNFPGTGLSTGKVREANDLTNAGLAMVKSLLDQGIAPDDIILQGDCFGAAIAMEVKEQMTLQADVEVRLIMNNSFKSFKAAVQDFIRSNSLIPNSFTKVIKALLEFTGWHLTPGKKFSQSGPYQCHIKHEGDFVLPTATLSDKVARKRSSEKAKYENNCPEDYKEAWQEIEGRHILKVKEEAKSRLDKKFGHDKHRRINAHFADLCELETLDGRPAYAGFVCQFIEKSNQYIENHPQKVDPEGINQKLDFLGKMHSKPIDKDQADQIREFQRIYENFENIEDIEDENINNTTGTSLRGG